MGTEPTLCILFSDRQIKAVVKRLAAEITKDYKDKQPLIVGILKGSFVFLADLIRLLDFPLDIDFVQLSSYGRGTVSSGEIKKIYGLRSSVKGRNVLVVEDIVDTGRTTTFFIDYLRKRKPASVQLCSLADKPARHQGPITIDYLGLTLPDKFVVGYGIDWDEKYRQLPDLCVLEFESRVQSQISHIRGQGREAGRPAAHQCQSR